MLVLLQACSPDTTGDLEHRSWSAQALSAQADWYVDGNEEGAWFGDSVSGAGDVNGDGFSDVIVGAAGFGDTAGLFRRGRAFGYYGTGVGLPTVADWVVDCPVEEYCEFGDQVSIVGDVDADGFDDAVVLSHNFPVGPAYLFRGSAVGLDVTAAWTSEAGQPTANFTTIGSGDFNGDGHTDIALGSRFHAAGTELSSGAVFVYDGLPSGLSVLPTWSSPVVQAGANIGSSVAATDVDGDGFDDLVVGGPGYDGALEDSGIAWLYRGSAAGLELLPAWTVEGDSEGAGFGGTLAAGDVDGDGFDDVIVGVYWVDEIRLFPGSAAGLATTPSSTVVGVVPVALASVPNLNGDAFCDLAVGNSTFSFTESYEGMVTVFLGNATGLDAASTWTALGRQYLGLLGASVANAGDVTGDGLDDVLAGAPTMRVGAQAIYDEGLAVVFDGACTGDDIDADGVIDSCDGCPLMADAAQTDTDGDGVGDICDPCVGDGADADGDAVCADVDCDDLDPNVYPGATELCDGKDTACAGALPADERDDDADGIHPCDGDCNDNDARVHPGATELCNGIDDDCDTVVPPNEADCDDSSDTDDDEPADDDGPHNDGGGCSCAVPPGGWGGSVAMIVCCALIVSRPRRV